MPISALKPCSHPGCNELIRGSSRCDDHKTVDRKLSDRHRGSAASRGYGHKWRKAREGFLAKHPYCIRCEGLGIVEAATVIDHIQPHRDDKELFWKRSNWQPLCKTCHDKKTATEDGGFGRQGAVKKFTAFIF